MSEQSAREMLANINLQEGSGYAGKGRHQKALKKYDKAIYLCPEMATAWFLKGHALCNLERFQEAYECLEKALTLEPDYAIALCYKGIALRALGYEDEGVECLVKAKQLGFVYPR